MIETIAAWIAGKAAGALGKRLGAILGDPRVIEALLVVAILGGVYWLGSHNGRLACEDAHKNEVIASQAATIADTLAAITDARAGAAQLGKDIDALHRGAAKAREDFSHALPSREADHGCDLPGGPTRRMLNQASGWPD